MENVQKIIEQLCEKCECPEHIGNISHAFDKSLTTEKIKVEICLRLARLRFHSSVSSNSPEHRYFIIKAGLLTSDGPTISGKLYVFLTKW